VVVANRKGQPPRVFGFEEYLKKIELTKSVQPSASCSQPAIGLGIVL